MGLRPGGDSQSAMRGSIEDGVKLTLLRAPDDELQSPDFQQEIRDFKAALDAAGVESESWWITQDSVGGWCGYVGVFVLGAVVPAVKSIIIAYLKRKTGRSMRVEFDGTTVKFDEPTEQEADRVLKLVEESKQKRLKK